MTTSVNSEKKDVVLFDYDNTLRITEAPTLEAAGLRLISLLNDKGVSHSLSIEKLQSEYIGIPFAVMLDRVAERFGMRLHPEERAQLIREEQRGAIEVLGERALPSPGAESALRRLKEMGVIMAVVSSSSPARLEACMQRAGQLDYITMRQVFSAEDPQSPTDPKPSPAIYTRALESLGMEAKRCIAVEDSVPGITAAVAAGIQTIGFSGPLPPSQRAAAAHSFFKAGARWAINDLAFVPAILNLINSGRTNEVDMIVGRAAF